MTIMQTTRSMNTTLLRGAAFRAADVENDGRTLEGYAAVFGVKTRINSWEGTFDEHIRLGAFRKTLRQGNPVMQFDHGRHPLIGSIPIGAYNSLGEDDHGLAVAGRLTDNWLIQPVRDAIAERTINGMSFRFEVVRDEWTDAQGKRIDPAKEADREAFYEILWRGEDHERGPLSRELIEVRMPEAGPVVFPAYGGTDVSVRARELARPMFEDDVLMHEVRSSLAIGVRSATIELPGDATLRREIARAVLFGTTPATRTTRTDAAPPPGHPAEDDTTPDDDDDFDDDTDDDVEDDDTPDDDDQDDDAAPAPSHPADPPEPRSTEQNDAPAATGHPSPSSYAARQLAVRRAYMTRERVGRM